MLSTCQEARAAGFTCQEARAAGFKPRECKQAGFTYEEGKAAGYPSFNFAVGSYVEYDGFGGCTVAVLHADGSVDIHIPGVGIRSRVARSAVTNVIWWGGKSPPEIRTPVDPRPLAPLRLARPVPPPLTSLLLCAGNYDWDGTNLG